MFFSIFDHIFPQDLRKQAEKEKKAERKRCAPRLVPEPAASPSSVASANIDSDPVPVPPLVVAARRKRVKRVLINGCLKCTYATENKPVERGHCKPCKYSTASKRAARLQLLASSS